MATELQASLASVKVAETTPLRSRFGKIAANFKENPKSYAWNITSK